jgi:urea transporter
MNEIRHSIKGKGQIMQVFKQAGFVTMSLLDGYGSFFALDKCFSKVLLFAVSFLIPATGFMGMLGGLFVIGLRKLFSLSDDYEKIDTVNGILLGMLIGSMYAISFKTIVLLNLGALLVIVAGSVLADTLLRVFRLPLLGLPYVVAAYLILPIAYYLLSPASNQSLLIHIESMALPFAKYLAPFGAIYYSGTAIGGILTLVAFAVSSRYLAAIGLCQIAFCLLILNGLKLFQSPDSILSLVAQMNAVLTACVIGGLYTVPSRRSFIVALVSGAVAFLLTISLNQIIWTFHLPVLALPFVITTYAVLLAFSPQHGGPWSVFWLSCPSLAEYSIERIKIAQKRGVDTRSVGLKPPFSGAWQIYQGFDGRHTHKGALRYALDFFQFENGLS